VVRSAGSAVPTALVRFGRIRVAVSCAAIGHTCWLEKLTIQQFDQVIAINPRGPVLVAKAVWPAIRQQGDAWRGGYNERKARRATIARRTRRIEARYGGSGEPG
jgi:NAD(P)-dependent dehydrogenase (short-subunit alcohol dehydrogenase family)